MLETRVRSTSNNSSSIQIGVTTVLSGAINQVLYIDSAGNLAGNSNFTFDGTTSFKLGTGTGLLQATAGVMTYDGFSTNNTWTGTQLWKNASNSTAAYDFQDSNANSMLRFDTTNRAMAMNTAIVTTRALKLVNPTDNQIVVFEAIQTLATKKSGTFAFVGTANLNWTGTANASINQAFSTSFVDTRTLNGTLGTLNDQTMTVKWTRAAGFSSSEADHRSRAINITNSDLGTYTSASSSGDVQLGISIASTYAPTISGSVARTLTGGGFEYSHTSNVATVGAGSTWTAIFTGFKASMSSGSQPTRATTTGYGFYTDIAGFGTNYSLYMDTASNAFFGKDASITSWGNAQDAGISFSSTDFLLRSDYVTSTDTLTLRAGTNGLAFNIGATQQAILTSLLFTTTNGVNMAFGGKVTTYNNIAVEAYGVPAIVDDVAITGRTTAITTTNFTNGQVAGTYRISYSLQDTTADVTAGTLTLTIAYTDGAGATTKTATQILTATGRADGVVYLQLASGNLTYAVSITGGVGIGTAVYALFMSCERLS